MAKKHTNNEQWRLTPATDPYDAVNNKEKYANKDKSYTGISSQVDLEDGEMRDVEYGDAKAFRDHENFKEGTDGEPIVPSSFDLTSPIEDISGIQKNPPETKTVGILFNTGENKMKKSLDWSHLLEKGRCWEGYEPVPGKKPYSDDSCRPKKKKKKDEAKKGEKKEVNVGGGDTNNRRTYLEAFGKSDSEEFVDIYFFDDGSFDVDPCESMSDDKYKDFCKSLEDNGYEELEKKKDWQPKAKHKSDKGGLTEAGRKSYNKTTGGNLKAPQPGGGKRKKSFCARNKGQIDMHNIDCKKTPEKRACKARRRWKC